MNLNQKHLEELKKLKHDSQALVGQRLRSYAIDVLGRHGLFDPSVLSDQAADREVLFNLTNNPSISTEICCAAIFGWGGCVGIMRGHVFKRCQDGFQLLRT